jgi:hypothetical protein
MHSEKKKKKKRRRRRRFLLLKTPSIFENRHLFMGSYNGLTYALREYNMQRLGKKERKRRRKRKMKKVIRELMKMNLK